MHPLTLLALLACDDGDRPDRSDTCFTGSARVWTPDGPRRIDALRAGDRVWAWDLQAHRPVARQIVQIHQGASDRLLRLRAGELTIAGVTASHPLYRPDTGEWIEAGEIAVDDALLGWLPGADAQTLRVDEREDYAADAPVDVFTLSLAGPERCFFVEGLLVHNKSPVEEELPFQVWLNPQEADRDNAKADECVWTLSSDYECQNGNPGVHWDGVPWGAGALHLVFDDPDAGGFDHWAVVNIPADLNRLDAGISGAEIDAALPEGAYELANGFGFDGYLGSCPPAAHVYRWRLFATAAPLAEGLTAFDEVESAASADAIDTAEHCHVYGPKL